MPATFNDGLVKGKNTSTPLTKKRFVVMDRAATDGETVKAATAGNTATEPLFGVSKFSVSAAEIAQGKGASVIMDGIAIVTAGEALQVGDVVTSDSEGRAVKVASGDWIGGVVNEPAAALGDDCSIDINCDGNTAA